MCELISENSNCAMCVDDFLFLLTSVCWDLIFGCVLCADWWLRFLSAADNWVHLVRKVEVHLFGVKRVRFCSK
ncbi:hypothetical protein M758_11G131400 [Ceratodon purpureus]|nr:hypothetical protein M758_11G131400 [Ceratodon purpureus]